MAVTTTYALNFIKTLDLTQGPTTAAPDAASLTNGGFAVSGGLQLAVPSTFSSPTPATAEVPRSAFPIPMPSTS